MLSAEKLSEYREVAKRWMSVDRSIAHDLLDEIDRLRSENLSLREQLNDLSNHTPE